MGTILIHAGMPKTGSTSIQTWLRSNAGYLRESHGIHILRSARAAVGEPSALEVYESGAEIMPIAFLLGYAHLKASGEDRALIDLTRHFLAAVDHAASRLGTVLLTAELFASLFIWGEREFLSGLQTLSERNEVRIAYYVRPQHTALESRWRQWGFRTGQRPRAWVLDILHRLRYVETLDRVEGLAPGVSVAVRPFRSDLMTRASVVADFVDAFLGIDDPPAAGSHRENPGLPLDFANLLRTAPAELLDGSPGVRGTGGGHRQLALAEFARRWAPRESDEARRSRQLLQEFAYREFEPGNRELIERLGWATDHFVPPPETTDGDATDLGDLDRLWEPRASDEERAYLYAALHELVNGPAHMALRSDPS